MRTTVYVAAAVVSHMGLHRWSPFSGPVGRALCATHDDDADPLVPGLQSSFDGGETFGFIHTLQSGDEKHRADHGKGVAPITCV